MTAALSVKMSASVKSRSRKFDIKESRFKKAEGLEDKKTYVYEPWAPNAYTAFKLLLSARLCSAMWSNISDCDEVYNYWEPMHYIMHGNGFQTWEYSPLYAIRSYAYLWLHIVPLKFYSNFFQPNKILQFYFLRCLLGFSCALCEVYFYRGICKQFGANAGRITLAFLSFSTGLFISSAAFLPSSFAMYTTMIAMGGWFLGQYHIAIFGIAAGAIIGWPFAVALGIPIAYDIVIRRRSIVVFIKWSVLSLLVSIIPLIQVDSHYYGGLVIAPLNIVLYNVLSDHGPDIYGVEQWTFYFINGFLNLNIAFILGLLVLPLAVFTTFIVKTQNYAIPLWLSLSPMYIWIFIFFTTPHKEERFLFPIYPLLCMGAAVALDCKQQLYHGIFRRPAPHYTRFTNWIPLTTCFFFAIISLSRITALFYGYHAPLDIYGELHRIAEDPSVHNLPPDKPVSVCVGKEWYRFPSHYFMPHGWHLHFLKSNFKGQLPKPFGKGPDATKRIPSHMNDLNEEEPSRYVNISKCHYLIDLDVPDDNPNEPRYSQLQDEWSLVHTSLFLDNQRSHRLYRAFHIPFLSDKHTVYVNYNLLKTRRTKKNRN